MRFLIVVPPFIGHVNPMGGVAAELTGRGHRVAWAGDPSLLPAGAIIHPCAVLPDTTRPPELRGFAALKHLWDNVLVPLTEVMTPGVEAAIDAERPDVVVADQQAFAGALVAERRGIPWVTSATTSSELVDPLAGMPAVAARIAEQLTELRKRFGDPAAEADPRFSPHLVLAFTSAALAGDAGPTVRFVGPIARHTERQAFDMSTLDPERPLVYVSLGTVNDDTGARFLTECAAALAERPRLQGVIVDPAGVVSGGHVVTAPRLPQPALLDRAAAVICHAGHNTVCESLARGVPLVVAPIRDDQPVIAQQVVAAGAGVRLRFTHATARHIGQALDAVLTEPAYRDAALRVRDSFTAAGGAPAAADALEALRHDTTFVRPQG